MTTDASTTTTKALEWEDIANGEFWGRQLQELLDTAYNVALKAIYALFILLVGWILIKIVVWLIGKLFNRIKMDVAVKAFLLSLIKFFLWMILWLQIFKIAEIPNTSFTAVMSALAFAIGMALSGFMNNILAGLVILTAKPFVVGDYIVGGGAEGVVKEITLTHTYVMSGDNKKQIVPNLPLATGTVVNASKNDTRRVDMVFGIAHEADLKDTREMFKRILKNHPAVLKEPAFVVEPDSLTPHGVNWLVRPWCKGSDYWTVHFDVHEAVHKTADELGINIPCPQSDVHLFKHTSEGAAAAAADEDADGAPSVIVTTTSTTIVEPVTTATTTTPTPGGPTEGGEEKKDKSKSTKSKDKGAEKKKTK